MTTTFTSLDWSAALYRAIHALGNEKGIDTARLLSGCELPKLELGDHELAQVSRRMNVPVDEIVERAAAWVASQTAAVAGASQVCTVDWCSGDCKWTEDIDGGAQRLHSHHWDTGVDLEWWEGTQGGYQDSEPAITVRTDDVELADALVLQSDLAEALCILQAEVK